MSEFIAFPSIMQIGKCFMCITQKLHGTNAQIYIYEEDSIIQIKAGSRNRWLTSEDDNYGFAKFVETNREVIIEKLGIGRHYGEWVGPGINQGEGLPEKKFYLFNHQRWEMIKHAIPQMDVVPVLYKGKVDLEEIDNALHRLKTNGSYIVPGYMNPEGIVIQVGNDFYKRVFNPEEVAWDKSNKGPRLPRAPGLDVSHLLQPIRLEKLLSRDERYRMEYPESLSTICKDYVADLIKEEQFNPEDEAIRKAIGREVFKFVKNSI